MSIARQVDQKLYRGPRPSPSDVRDLFALGIVTMISLEYGYFEFFHGEMYQEDDVAWTFGMSVRHIALSDFRAPTADQVREFFRIVDGVGASFFVHCKRGKDRTGFVCAAYRVLRQGWSVDDAVAEWKELGFNHWFYFWWESAFRKMMREWKV